MYFAGAAFFHDYFYCLRDKVGMSIVVEFDGQFSTACGQANNMKVPSAVFFVPFYLGDCLV